MTTGVSKMNDMYRAILWVFSIRAVWFIDEWITKQVDKELKWWRNIVTKTRLSKEERMEYLQYAIDMFAKSIHRIRFDSDRYKFEGIKYTILPYDSL